VADDKGFLKRFNRVRWLQSQRITQQYFVRVIRLVTLGERLQRNIYN